MTQSTNKHVFLSERVNQASLSAERWTITIPWEPKLHFRRVSEVVSSTFRAPAHMWKCRLCSRLDDYRNSPTIKFCKILCWCIPFSQMSLYKDLLKQRYCLKCRFSFKMTGMRVWIHLTQCMESCVFCFYLSYCKLYVWKSSICWGCNWPTTYRHLFAPRGKNKMCTLKPN